MAWKLNAITRPASRLRTFATRGVRVGSAAAAVALLAAGLGVGGAIQAGASGGVFTAPGSKTLLVVPSWVTSINARAIGGAGGAPSGVAVAHGADVTANIPVTPGTNLYVSVAASPLNGGAAGSGGATAGSSGGGVSDISKCSSGCTGFGTATDPRLIVAAGGGGAGGAGGVGASGVGGAAGGGAVSTAPSPACKSGSNGTNGGAGASDAAGNAGHAPVCNAPPAVGGISGTGGAAAGSGAAGGGGQPGGAGGTGGAGSGAGGGGGGGGSGYLGGGAGSGGGTFGGGGGGGGAGASYTTTGATGATFATATGTSPSVIVKYVPGAPTNVTAAAGNAQATVSWTPPADQGGAATVTSYTVTPCPTAPAGACLAGTVFAAPATSGTIGGLTNGTTYVFFVNATNSIGTGPTSASSNAVKPMPDPPGAPTNVIAVGGNRSATVSWTPPASDGGAPITAYSVISSPGGIVKDVEGSVTSTTITGLTNELSYTFTVTATNMSGTGPPSAKSNPVTPHPTKPGAPTNVVATAGNSQATVTWSPPADDGGSPITSYTVTSSPGPRTMTVNASTTSATFTGLTNGLAYTFTVTATNGVGTGPGATSNPVTPAADVPGAPTNVTAVAGNASATVSWTPPADNGGSAITGFKVKPCPTAPAASCGAAQSFPASATSGTVTLLTNGTTYVFVVAATNAVGTGPDSDPSNAVTPTGPPPPPSIIYSQSWNSFSAAGWTQQSGTGSSDPKWNLTSACSANHSGSGSFGWYYGKTSTCNYDNGTTNTGSLYSPIFGTGSYVAVPKGTTFHITVWSKRKVESCSSCSHDQTNIHVDYQDGKGFQRVYYKDAHNPSTGAWEQLTLAVNSPTGKMQVRFRFQTVSSVLNNFYGWAIDDFAVTN